MDIDHDYLDSLAEARQARIEYLMELDELSNSAGVELCHDCAQPHDVDEECYFAAVCTSCGDESIHSYGLACEDEVPCAACGVVFDATARELVAA